jgi:hypothetical protein
MTEWTKLVKQVYEKNKNRANYSLGKAMKEAKKLYNSTKKIPGKAIKKVKSLGRKTKKGVLNAPGKAKSVAGQIYRGTMKALPKISLKGGKKGKKGKRSRKKYKGGNDLDDLKSKIGLKGGAVDTNAAPVGGSSDVPQASSQSVGATTPGTAPVNGGADGEEEMM